jgi:hypothetical protein
MNIVTALAGVATATLIGTALSPETANATPVTPVSDAACFVQPIGPFKTNASSIAPIGYGFRVHCMPRDPDLRAVTVKLWRKDVHTGQEYVHAEQIDHGTKATDQRIYYASCSTSAVLWEFHTEAIATAVYDYSGDYASGDSDSVLLHC